MRLGIVIFQPGGRLRQRQRKMRRYRYIWILLVLLIGTGCRTVVPIGNTSTNNTYTYHEQKSGVVSFEPDSATMRLLFECDSAGNVLLRALEQEQGKRLSLEAQLKQTAAGTIVEIDCKQDSLQKVIDRLREIIRESSNESTTETIEVKVIPKFHKACAWIVCIEIFALILWIVVKFVR